MYKKSLKLQEISITTISIFRTNLSNESMVFRKKYDESFRKHIRVLRNELHFSIKKTSQITGVSTATVKRICRIKEDERPVKKRQVKPAKRGRPRTLKDRDVRKLIQQIKKFREDDNGGNFTIKDVRNGAGLNHVPLHTVRRALHRQGFGFRVARRKGMLTGKDLRARVNFAKKMVKEYSADVWSKEITFYLDGKSFKYTRNPLASAKCTRSRACRKVHEGLFKGCTAKGSKCGTGVKKLDLVVCISHGKGVCLVEKYDKMDGRYFTSFVQRKFPYLFAQISKTRKKLWIQDGDPSQNCKSARLAWEELGANLLKIPPRSPDLNPIENVFHLAAQALNRETIARSISKETYEEFSSRVIRTLYDIPTELVNKTIESVSHRITQILSNGGLRLKY